MKMLKIPFAKDFSGKYVFPENARSGRMYFCPLCDQIILFNSEPKGIFFTHPGELKYPLEVAMYLLAKKIIIHTIEEWKAGHISSPVILRKCKICEKNFFQPLPDKVTSSKEDCSLNSEYKFDVCIFSAYQVVAGILIQESDSANEIKKNTPTVPFVVVSGKAILENPTLWVPVLDNFKQSLCPDCRDQAQ
jgi:hypothetical protein